MESLTLGAPGDEGVRFGADLSACALVLNFFGAMKTARCLESLARQGLAKVIVVDNSADDREWDALKPALRKAAEGLAPTETLLERNRENLGFGGAINAALRREEARGSGHAYYLLLNNDTVLRPSAVARLAAAMEGEPEAALASPLIESDTDAYCFRWYKRFFGHHTSHPVPWTFPYLTGCCLLVRAEVAREGPLFDESFFMYGEDIDLSWRQVRKGRRLLGVEEASVYHEGRGSTDKLSYFFEYHLPRGQMLLASRMCKAGWERPFMVLGRTGYLTARALVRCVRYRSLVPARALLASLLGGTGRSGRAAPGPAGQGPASGR